MLNNLEETLETHFNKPEKIEKIIKDKADKQTTNKVLDINTLRILNKLKEFIEIKQCIQSGKEANIYEGILKKPIKSKYTIKEIPINQKNTKVVIKIYRTSTMEFKKRNPYLSERFENITNSRKLIKIWAEKEMRNLKRIQNVGISSPIPLFLKRNVLVLEMITYKQIDTNDIIIAPRLKDLNNNFLIKINESYNNIYKQTLDLINSLYNDAKIVHADLSEYNLLFSNTLTVIDVSQSVDIYHENALRFLIIDITNINNFFNKKSVEIISIKDIFEKITKRKVNIDILTNSFKIIKELKDININNKEEIEYFLKNKDSSNKDSSNNNNKKEKKISKFNLTNLSKIEIKERRSKLKEERKIKRMTRKKKIIKK